MCPFIFSVQAEDMMAVPFSYVLVYVYVNDIASLTEPMLASDFQRWLRWIVNLTGFLQDKNIGSLCSYETRELCFRMLMLNII